MIDELDVVRRVGAEEDLADRAARERVRVRVLGDGSDAAAATRAPRWRRLLTIAVPAAAVGLGVALVLALVPGGDQSDFASDDRRPATTEPLPTAPAPELFPKPDEFLYVRSDTRYMECVEGATPRCRLGPARKREVWVSERQEGRLVQKPSGNEPTKLSRVRYQLGNRSFTRTEIERYTPAPRDLLRSLRRGTVPGQGGDARTYPFVQLTDALREVPMPVAVRRSIVGAFALVPGVVERGEVVDSRGRRGIGFARSIGGEREEVVIDPVTSTMIEERTVLLDPAAVRGGFERGDEIGRATYAERAVVKQAGQRP